jgi:hypothetical protein
LVTGTDSQVSSAATAGSGTISLNGTGGDGVHKNYGVAVFSGAEVLTINDNIVINGVGGNGIGANNSAVRINSSVKSTGSGNITIESNQKSGSIVNNNSKNIFVTGNGSITGGTGSINLNSTSLNTTTVNGTVRSSGGDINFGGELELQNKDVVIDTTNSGANAIGGNITFGGDINNTNSGTQRNLTIKAGSSGKTTFNGIIGANTEIGDLNVISGGGVDFNENVTSNSILADTSSGSGNINLGAGKILTANATSGLGVNLTTAAGSIIANGGIIQTNGGSIDISGALNLATSGLIVRTNLNVIGGNINFNDTVDGAQNLIITSGTAGKTTFNGIIGANTEIGDLNVVSGGGVDFNKGITANTILANSTSGTGDIKIGSGGFLKATSTTGIVGTANSSNPSGSSIILASGGNFENNSGNSNPLTTSGSSRYLVYSSSPADDFLGGITRDTKRYNRNLSDNSPNSVNETGNVFLYYIAPTLTVNAGDSTTTYGDTATLSASVSGMIDGDLATDLHDGGASLDGSAVNAGTYNGIISGDSVTSTAIELGYQVVTVDGDLTIDKATLIASADDQSKFFGDSNPFLTANFSGFKNGDNANSAGIIDVALNTAADASSNVGDYDIDIDVSSASSNNYNFVKGVDNGKGTLTVNPALNSGETPDLINSPDKLTSVKINMASNKKCIIQFDNLNNNKLLSVALIDAINKNVNSDSYICLNYSAK